MDNTIEKTVSQQALALATFCTVYANKEEIAIVAREEFNLQERFGHLVKLAFPEFANVEPGDLDENILSKEYMSTALESLSRGATNLQCINEAAKACLVLILANSEDLAHHAINAASGSASENVFIAFPGVAAARTRRLAFWALAADINDQGFATDAQILSSLDNLYPYGPDEFDVEKLQETAALEIAATHEFIIGI